MKISPMRLAAAGALLALLASLAAVIPNTAAAAQTRGISALRLSHPARDGGQFLATAPATGRLGRIVVRVVSSRPSPDGDRLPGHRVSAVCMPKLNHYNRTQLCARGTITASIYNTEGMLVGTDVITWILSMQLAIKSTKFVETDTVTKVVPAGEIPSGFNMTLDVTCGNNCTVINNFPPASPVEAGVTGTLDYSETVAPGAFNLNQTSYTLNFVAPGYTPIQLATWMTPLNYRCDDMLNGQSAGCVFSAYPPTLTTMTKLPAIAANIKKIQTNGPGHYGQPGSGKPLHRLVDKKRQRQNYNAVCGKSVVGPPPPGKSCDEYPFATTYEGGTALSAANRGWAWVPATQQDRQGGLLRAFYYQNRILDTDAFFVKV